MRMLILTQAVDEGDSVLGFFVRWIAEFAKHCEHVEVICLREGVHSLPDNVRVHSLGKEKGGSRGRYLLNFYKTIWRLRHTYDKVFVHMNPEYVILGGVLWRILGKRIALWYMHKAVNARLRLAVFFAHTVFTASPLSMRVRTPKKRIVGHGIDLQGVRVLPPPSSDTPVELLTVGRISPVKHIELLIDALSLVREKGGTAVLTVVGGTDGPRAAAYLQTLRERAEKKQVTASVRFLGPRPHDSLAELFAGTHLFVSASDTGSLDKASLEPLAAGIPVVTTNAELSAAHISAIIPAVATAESLAQGISGAVTGRLYADGRVREEARAYVDKNHSLERLIPRILAFMAETA